MTRRENDEDSQGKGARLERRQGGFFRRDSEGKLVQTPTRPRPLTPWPQEEDQNYDEKNGKKAGPTNS